MKKPEEFLNVVNIPAAKIGRWWIKRSTAKPGHPFETTNSRTAIMGGHKGPTLKFDHPTIWHELGEGRGPGRWMSDLPIEQAQIDYETKTLRRGTVLVGGLGIGYVASILARRPLIKRVCVVERAPEVMQLVAEYVCKGEACRSKIDFVQDDLLHTLEFLGPQSFDHAYYDIWTNDGEATFFGVVMPLLRLSATRIRKEPINWNESVMRGQLRFSLDSRYRVFKMFESQYAPDEFKQQMMKAWGSIDEFCAPVGNPWRDWSVGFFRWVRRAEPNEQAFQLYCALYAHDYGRRGFETKWKALTGEDAVRCELQRRDIEDDETEA